MTTRSDDPDSKRHFLRVALARVRGCISRNAHRFVRVTRQVVRDNPVLVGMTFSLLIASVALTLVLGEQAKGRERDRSLKATVLFNRQLAITVQDAVEQIQREATERQDQSCKVSEQGHLDDVNQLRDTYKFLVDHPDSELSQAILPQLPEVEKRAHTDRAPDFCDQPNIGLPEPDPIIPKRPKAVSDLLSAVR